MTPASGDAGGNAGTMHGMTNAERQAGSSDGETSAQHLGTLLRQVSKTSIGEIDSLIAELKTLHKKLQTDGDRIQRTCWTLRVSPPPASVIAL